eukprot:TRINITY_DN60881_c0_g1_i1.p1 TRINITY_DN60881_c0_g1~~TRINITY_DN60881_c0_g1_i1.p1  ORF type:complete len:1267 (+),score=247.96 TRINITY_DN60881_c0_g1_i1:71-3871(+)
MYSTWHEGFAKRKARSVGRPVTSSTAGALPGLSPKGIHGQQSKVLEQSISEPALRNSKGSPIAGNEATLKRCNTLPGGGKAFMKRIAMGQRDFEKRQTHMSTGAQATQALSRMQRRFVDDMREHEQSIFFGGKGVSGFRQYLREKFGCVYAGWRELDVNGNGRLSFCELCSACKKMGYGGNVKKLWGEMDTKLVGFVTLTDLDPDVGRTVGTFRDALLKKYGNLLVAWREGIDVNKNGRVEEHELAECCQRLGLVDVNSKKLFTMMKSKNSQGMTLQEFDPDAYNSFASGDLEGKLIGGARAESSVEQEPIGNVDEEEDERGMRDAQNHDTRLKGSGLQAWRQELTLRCVEDVKQAEAENYKFRLGLHTVPGFQRALKLRCGSLLGAWRKALDLDGNERITYGEFNLAMSKLGFHGNVKGLWDQLCKKDKKYIEFSDFDPVTAAALTEFRQKMIAHWGNMLLAWIKGLDTNGNGTVSEDEFVNACSVVGYSGNARSLFRNMRPEAGRTCLSLEDFDTKAFIAFHRGDFRMLGDVGTNAPKQPLEMTFEERQSSGYAFQASRALDAAQREEFASVCRIAASSDVRIDTVEEFKAVCTRTYGSMIGAWRNCLDADRNGKLTFCEFCNGCRRLGYAGDLKALWAKYDVGRKGYVVLKDFDEKAHNLVKSFHEKLLSEFGSLDDAWRKGFGKDPHECIDEAQLVEACQSIGYEHDAQKLFRCLQSMPGKQQLTIWDIDPESNRKRERGEQRLIANPKSPLSNPERRRNRFGEEKDDANAGAVNIMDTVSLRDLLQSTMRTKCGSTAVAWRMEFDPNMQGSVTFSCFCAAADRIAFKGRLRPLWEQLVASGGKSSPWENNDPISSSHAQNNTAGESLRITTSNEEDNAGTSRNDKQEKTTPGVRPQFQGQLAYVSFSEVDPHAQLLLTRVREQLVERYGSLYEAWGKCLDKSGTGRVSQEAFCEAGQEWGIPLERLEKVFRLLRRPLDGQPSRLMRDDLRSLLIGVPHSDQVAVWGEEAMQPPELSPLANSAKMVKEHHSQDVCVTSLKGFKKMLVRKFGGLYAAWILILDVTRKGVLTRKEFAAACQRMGVKAVRQLWHEMTVGPEIARTIVLKDPEKEQITLKDFDGPLGEGIASLEALLVEQHGSSRAGWSCCFEPNGMPLCSEKWFVKGCAMLGYPGDASALFHLLRPEPYREALVYEDIWTWNSATSRPSSPSKQPQAQVVTPTQDFEAASNSFDNGAPEGTQSLELEHTNFPTQEHMNQQNFVTA